MTQFLDGYIGGYYFWGLIGFSVGTVLVMHNLTGNGVSFPTALLVWTAAVYAGLLGSRALFILETDPRLFIDNLPLAVAFWQGGLAWQGGAFLGSVGAFIGFKLAGKPGWSNIGCCAPGLALSHAIARIACIGKGCCYGAPTTVPWAIHSDKLNAMVHPTQVYSMICEVLVAVLLQVLWRKPEHRKYLIPLYGMLLAIHRFFSEAFRGTPAGPELIPGLRFYQGVCVLLFVISLGAALLSSGKRWAWLATAALVLVTSAALAGLMPAHNQSPPQQAGSSGTYLVATRSMFIEELAPWKAAREREGFTVEVGAWAESPSSGEVQNWLRAHAPAGRTFILVVGDCRGEGEAQAPWHVPSVERPNAQGAGQETFVCDALFGDVDDDACPDVPVGRLPVRSEAALRLQVKKILGYGARQLDPSWLRAHAWAGFAGHQEEMHELLEHFCRQLPPWLGAFALSGKRESPFSGHLPDQPDLFLQGMREPALISVIASHGSFDGTVVAKHEERSVSLSVEDVARLDSTRALGPLFLLACDAGMFATTQERGPSLAEAFVEHAGGPIVVVAASRRVLPATNCLMVRAMVAELDAAPQSAGEYLLAIQRLLCQEGAGTLRELADKDALAARFIDSGTGRATLSVPGLLRGEALSYSLLGDPACPLRVPRRMEVQAEKEGANELVASGKTPPGCGRLYVHLMPPEENAMRSPPGLTPALKRKRLEDANPRPATLAMQPIDGEAWSVRVPLPAELPESYCVRFLALGRDAAFVATYP